MGCVSILEVFGDKQPPFISGYVWKEKKNKRKTQVSSYSQTKTELCGKWKLLLDGAVFDGKSKEVENIRRMCHYPRTQVTQHWQEEKVFTDRILTERGLDKEHKETSAWVQEQEFLLLKKDK